MLYGGTQFLSATSNVNCKDVSDFEENERNNCSTISIAAFQRFDLTAYYLYRLTFGNALDEANMNLIDPGMKNPLIGAYIGVTTLVLINMFIALLSTTFSRVFGKAEAYIIFQRATEILNKEKSMSYSERKDHVEYIRKIGNPYIDKTFKEVITTMDDRMTILENKVRDNKKAITTLNTSVDQMVS